MAGKTDINRAAATKFIEAFNNDAWEDVEEVVAPNFVLHHPIGGTNQLGAEGMIAVWSHFKAALPDSWHPLPIMITEGDYLANLLPTYGHFTGDPHHGVPPTGEWLEYGMVNLVRFEDGRLAEAWFGMDPMAEMQQMGVAPRMPQRELTEFELANVELFERTMKTTDADYDNITAFGDVVVALGPPQHGDEAKVRRLEIYRLDDGGLTLVRSYEFPTIPPFGGALSVDTDASKAVVEQFFEDVLITHDVVALKGLLSPDVLIHPTAMPCEASFYGPDGAHQWLEEMWSAFPDVRIVEYFFIGHGDIVVARWVARGTSEGVFMGQPATGEKVEFTGVSMFRIEEGRIAEIWDARNTFGILTQLNPELAGHHHH